MGGFLMLGKLIAKAPPLFALLMPVISVVVVILGFQDLKVETSVNKLWIPESTAYAENSKYKTDIIGGADTSSFLGISLPRQGGNVLTASLLLELMQRLKDTQQTRVSLDNMTFSFEDVCYNPAGAYVWPCFRMHVLDCFAEGGYDFSDNSAKIWRGMVEAQMLASPDAAKTRAALIAASMPAARAAAVQTGLAQAVASLYKPFVDSFLAQPVGLCKDNCTYDGPPASIAPALNVTPGTWETVPACAKCLNVTYNFLNQTTRDQVYVNVIQQTFSVSASALQLKYNASSQKEACDDFMKTLPPLVQMVKAQVQMSEAQIRAYVEAMVDAGIKADVQKRLKDQTPYTFRTDDPDPAVFGTSRPRLNSSTGVLASDAEVLAAASGTCFAWDGGQALPPNLNTLLYGKPSPPDYSSANKSLTSVEALQHVYRLVVPEDLQKRLSANRNLNITLDQAKEILETYKKSFEDAFSAGWDNTKSGDLQNTAFFDDSGSDGTFARTLSELTTDSVPLIAIYGGLTVLLSALFFISCDCVASQVVLVMLGSLFAILGCIAALALSALFGISLNVVHFWTMPFIIIGIGIDDMFMLALSSQTVSGGSTADSFAQAFANVGVPVTMTSLVNAAMFAIMSFTSDIRAVYEAGYTGLMATVILLLTMLLSFSALVYLDAKRRAASRYEFLPCMKSTARKEGATTLTELLRTSIYTRMYRPLVSSRIGQSLMLIASVGLLVAAAVGLSDLKVGLDLQDFFPEGTSAGKFAQDRNKYFPLWPVEMNWGQLDYTDPDVQLRMAREFEDVLGTAHIAGQGVHTSLVWTAALAEWGQASSTDPACKSVWKENTLGLRLNTSGGICYSYGNTSRCPVFEGLSQEQLAQCIRKWQASDTKFAAIAPGIPMNSSDGKTPLVPIRFSMASGSALFAYNLATTDDYTSMIKETRQYVDDDASLKSWMSGIPFDYWEQYLTIVQLMLIIGGLSILAGFVISFVFIFVELTFNHRGSVLQRLFSSGLGALLIALTSAASLMSVVGFCGLAGIQLSGFTAISCVMSTGLAVEYSVHVTHRFLEAPEGPAIGRIHHAMEWLFAPSAMAFLTSAVSVLMMAFSEFRFVRLYFFAPLACAVLTSYLFGGFTLPCLLGLMECVPALTSPAEQKASKADAENPGDGPNASEPEVPTTPLSKSNDETEI